MKAVLVALIVIIVAAVCAWNVAASLCVYLLVGTRPSDFVCGYNVLLQLLPLFLSFLVVFSFLVRRINGRGK